MLSRLHKTWENANHYDMISLSMIFLIFLFRLWYAAGVGLAHDEAYYWVWSRFPALSYFDHPPLVSYFILLTTNLIGNTALGVRLSMICISAFVSLMVFLMARRLAGSRAAFLALVILNVNILSSLGGFLVTPDTPLVLFWTLSLFTTLKLVESDSRRWWYMTGVMLGLGLLGKYMMILLLPVVALCCLLRPGMRRWLLDPAPLLSLIVASVLFLPVVIWNWQHDWMSFQHQFSHGLVQKKDFTLLYLVEYLGGQLLVANPFFFVCLMIATMGGLSRHATRSQTVLALSTAVPLAFFAFSSLRARVEANWPAIAYIGGSVLLAQWFDRRLSGSGDRSHLWKRSFCISVFLYVCIAAAIFLHMRMDIVSIDVRNDRTHELFGWDQVGNAVAEELEAMPVPDHTFLIANSYQLASQVWFNSPGQIRVYEDPTRGRANVFTVTDNFDGLIGQDALYIASTRDNPLALLHLSFDQCDYVGDIHRYRAGRKIGSLSLYRCFRFRGWNSFQNQHVAQR